MLNNIDMSLKDIGEFLILIIIAEIPFFLILFIITYIGVECRAGEKEVVVNSASTYALLNNLELMDCKPITKVCGYDSFEYTCFFSNKNGSKQIRNKDFKFYKKELTLP